MRPRRALHSSLSSATGSLRPKESYVTVKRVVTAKRFGAASAFLVAVCLSLLLFVWPKFQRYRQSFLVYSSLNGSISKMKLALALGADANQSECEAANCWTPLVAAAAANQPKAVQL